MENPSQLPHGGQRCAATVCGGPLRHSTACRVLLSTHASPATSPWLLIALALVPRSLSAGRNHRAPSSETTARSLWNKVLVLATTPRWFIPTTRSVRPPSLTGFSGVNTPSSPRYGLPFSYPRERLTPPTCPRALIRTA